ncbi:MAG: DUF4381 domain-containing protein [Bacteroidetes bacterium]|nr:DUF4381 domain-containing protein [Bacteroidota bacterium]
MKIVHYIISFYPMAVLCFQQEEDSSPEMVGDILEPDPLPFTFETIGWKILGVVLLIVASILFYKWLKLYQKNKYRREAIKKLKFIEANNTQSQYKINQLNIILKQVAMVTFGREQVAQLYGNDWFLFLDSKSEKSTFVKYSSNFTDAIYSKKEVDDTRLKSIYKLTKTWINEHS